MSRMLEEIRQQPEALERTLSAELRSVEKFKRLVEKQRPRLVVLVARGTSDNAALFGRYLLEITTGIPVSLAAPSIATLYEARVDYRDALVVGISQSGESTDTNLVLERARQQGALTLGITNESGSAMARIAEHVFLVRAGREKSVAATKTYTGQMLMMYLLAYALGGGVQIADLERIPDVVRRRARARARDRRSGRALPLHAACRGRGARPELLQRLRVGAEADGDLLRGGRALLLGRLPARPHRPGGTEFPGLRIRASRKDVAFDRRDAHQAAGLAGRDRRRSPTRATGRWMQRATRVIRLPRRVKEILTPIPYIVPAQIFAACLAAHKGLDPDKPRTLTKVTLTL